MVSYDMTSDRAIDLTKHEFITAIVCAAMALDPAMSYDRRKMVESAAAIADTLSMVLAERFEKRLVECHSFLLMDPSANVRPRRWWWPF